jgi:glycosyltransferase involved in cell wall biosynthesis
MYKDLRVAAIVPAYNESLLIAKTIRTMPDFIDHIVVIDDCSTDDTADKAVAAGDPRLVLIRHKRNTGVGGAVLDGHRRALKLGADVNVVMGGDAQMDPAYLPDLLDPIAEEGVEFTKANRFFSRTSYSGMPRHRVFGSIVLSFMTKLASGYWHLFDPQNGYTATSRSALERIDLDDVSLGYQFENDMLIRLNIADVWARDVPVPAVYGDEVSGMRMRKVVPAIGGLLLRGFWRRIMLKYVLYSFSPVALFLFSGLALFLLGAGFGTWVCYEAMRDQVPSAATVMAATAPLLTGIHFMVNAMMLDIQESPDWNPRRRPHRGGAVRGTFGRRAPEPVPIGRPRGADHAGTASSDDRRAGIR